MNITAVRAREILDSRGNPTVEAEVALDTGETGRAAVPSGASTGSHEAIELRDGDAGRYGGKGVLRAVANVNGEIAQAVVGKDASKQRELDETLIALDGTENRSRLGANAILAVSLAAAHAAARSRRIPLFEYVRTLSEAPREPRLPLPLSNIVNGGVHTAWQSTDIQEFMVLPIGATTFREGIRAVAEIFHTLKDVLREKGYGTTVGDEGGYAPRLAGGNEEALSLIGKAVEQAGYALGRDIVFALDAAATEFREDGAYALRIDNKKLTSAQLTDWYGELARRYPIVSIEDGLAEDDWDGWKQLTGSMGASTQLVGDDLFVTNQKFIERGIAEGAGNAVLIKPNQIGTLTETIRAVDRAHTAGWRCIVSHRSGETEDTTIAHLAVGLGTGQIKTGSLSRSERTGKYNELLRIEEALGEKAAFAGNVFA
jgi:enolase